MPSVSVSEVMPPGVRSGFEGYRAELAATVRARQRETLCAVVQDRSGLYHVLDTGSRPRHTVSPVADLAPGLQLVRWVNRSPPPAREAMQSRLAAAQRAYRDYQRQGSSRQRSQARATAERLHAALMPDAFGVAEEEVYIARDRQDRRTGKIGFCIDLGSAVAGQAGLARFPQARGEQPGAMAILIGPSAFEHGIVFAQSTLAHESTHLAIDLQALEVRERWLGSRSRLTFDAWLDLERRRGRLSALDYELVSERLGDAESSAHVVIYVEQFANLFHHVGDRLRMKAALDELGKGSSSWRMAGPTARETALDRFEQYVRALDTAHRTELETYLQAPERRNMPGPEYFAELLQRLRRVER